MEDSIRKREIVKAIANVEYHPVNIKDEDGGLDTFTRLPLAKVAAMGIAFEPLVTAFQNIVLGNGAVSGLYRVTVPNGGHLAAFRDGSGYLGTVLNGKNAIAGQATLAPLAVDPVTLLAAVALMGIEKKLDSIHEAQVEIIEFLEQKEKSKLRGNLSFLTDVLNNYKYNWNNEKYKNSNHIKVLDIKQDAEQSILFYRGQIEKKIKRESFFHSDKDVQDKIKKIQSELKEYRLALYLYSFSAFLDVMLLGNFESAYLDGVAKKIDDYSYQYRELYTMCFDQIEKYSKSSIQSHVLSGLAGIHKVAGEVVAKVPVVSKSQIDETLIETSSRLGKLGQKRIEQTMGQLVSNQSSEVHPFIDNINTIKRLYNQPVELLFDKECIYVAMSA